MAPRDQLRIARPSSTGSASGGRGAGHDIGAAHLAHPLVGHADDGHLGDGLVAAQHGLDLGRVGVEAAHDEHVLDAVGDGDVAGRVHDADVAGVQPALGIDRLRRRRLVAPVARHHRVAPHDDLARLARRHLAAVRHGPHLQAGYGAARGGGDDLGRIAAPAHGHGPAGLGQAVGGEDGVEPELVAHGLHQLDRHHGGAGHPEPQRRQVVLGAAGIGQQRLVERRRPRQHADALGADAGHHGARVEHRLGHHGGAGHEAGQDARLVAEGVEEGVDDEVAVARRRGRRWRTTSRTSAGTVRGSPPPPWGARSCPR